MSKADRDYEAYVRFCARIEVEPIGQREGFYGHDSKLLAEYGYKKLGRSYKKIN